MVSMPEIDRFHTDGMTDRERDQMYRTAPRATRGYYDLIDAVNDPSGDQSEIDLTAQVVEDEIRSRIHPKEEGVVINGFRRYLEQARNRNN
jgi:hypothetical protein